MAGRAPATATTSAGSAAEGRERGSGLLPAVAGVTVFLVLLLFAVQVLLGLYATSVVTGAAYDAARQVAAGAEEPAAEAHARSVMGRYGERVEFEWSVEGDDVVLHVVGGDVDRTVRARIECVRDEEGACG